MMRVAIALSIGFYVANTNSVDRFTNNTDLERVTVETPRMVNLDVKSLVETNFGLRNDQIFMQLAHMLELHVVLYIGEVIQGILKMQSLDVVNQFLLCFGYAHSLMVFLLLVLITARYIDGVMKVIQKMANFDVGNPQKTCFGLKETVAKYPK